MATKLKFKASAVAELLAHAMASKEFRPTYNDLFDPTKRKDGKEPDGMNCSSDDIDPTKLKPGLHFIKDSGIYLMSNGAPGLIQIREGEKQRSHVVCYAEGYDNKADYDKIVHAAGGDDFVEFVDADVVKSMLDHHPAYFVIKLSANKMEFTHCGHRKVAVPA